ncbi:MAG: ATP-binding cassette domain-containing protein [Acidobacteria bacterium]|nr:MAG: ATP-binding cassette domain-containing protein [Acidobacteriota bacterium]
MIQVEHLTKRFGLATAVQDVSFEVRKGEILGFLGPNGAGKTTTMRVLAGFFPPSDGRASVAGFDVFEQPLEAKKRVGYMPEQPPLYTEMSVDAFLRFVGRIKGLPADKLEPRLGEVKELCGLHGTGQRLIKHLSKGYKQRVGLAQALIHDPEVLILDEPTVGLDPKQIIEVRELIKRLAGIHTIILSTHILPEVSMTCQRVIIINKGRIVAVDTPENLTSQLRGGERIELEVRGPVDTLPTALGTVPHVKNVLIGAPGPHDGHHTVSVDVDGQHDVRHLIARRVLDSGFELYQLKTQAMTLEEIFLQLTTEEEAA